MVHLSQLPPVWGPETEVETPTSIPRKPRLVVIWSCISPSAGMIRIRFSGSASGLLSPVPSQPLGSPVIPLHLM